MSIVKNTFINRDEEREIFRQMLRGERREHILLIQADGGMGKTHLLHEFEALSDPFSCVRIDLSDIYTRDRILFKLCEDFDLERFPNFYAVCWRLAGGSTLQARDNGLQERQQLLDALTNSFNGSELRLLCVKLGVEYEDINGTTLSEKCLDLIEYVERRSQLSQLVRLVQQERPHISTGFQQPRESTPSFSLQVWNQAGRSLRSLGSEERNQYYEDLTGAYVEDLRQYCLRDMQQRIVVLFDTYDSDKGSYEVKKWLTGSFLRMARLLPNLVVVVAGRDIPRLNRVASDWRLKRELRELQPDHVKEFVERLQLTVDDDVITTIHRYSGGNPSLLAGILDNLMEGEDQ